MTQIRLSSLVMQSIENQLATDISYDTIINYFTAKKAEEKKKNNFIQMF